MELEREYIKYLIENISIIDSSLIDAYFLNEIEFSEVIDSIDTTEVLILSYSNFRKSKIIDDLLR